MKKIFTLLALTISFSMNAQLTAVTEGGNTGQRLSTSNASNHGDIGFNAVDLSYQSSASSVRGATGNYSTAMGRQTKAPGYASTAMGYYTSASGYSSTAMGYYTLANGLYSTAMGRSTEASGDYSTAMGRSTTASDYASTVIGQYNSSGDSVTNNALFFSTSNTAFVIGNGADSSNKSDAFKVMFNGDAYISSSLYLGGTAITATAAEINLLDGVTTVGILSSVTENGNTGQRLSTSNASNHGDIGSNAVDLSYSSISGLPFGATGNYSTAMGHQTTASGDGSTAM